MTPINRPLNILLHAIFFMTGISTVLIGQVLPILSKKLALNDVEAANFFIAQFVGSLSGVFIYNSLVKKFGFNAANKFGLISIIAGITILNADFQSVCAVGFFLHGIGIGTTLPAINMQIAEANPLRTASALNFLNFFWGFGAIFSQPFVFFLSAEKSILLPTSILAVIFLVCLSLMFFLAPKIVEKPKDFKLEKNISAPIWKNPIAWLIAVFNFLHVGMESGISGWLTTYSERFSDVGTNAVSATPIFFLLFVAGRLFAPVTIRIFSENLFILLSLVVLTGGILTIVFASNYYVLLFGAGISGFGTSAIFPTNMARFTKIFGEGATRNATPIFIMGSLGSAFTTWFIGFVSNYFENLRSGILVLLGSSLILIVLQAGISATEKAKNRYLQHSEIN